MFYVIVIIFSIIIAFCLYSKKFKNPYKLIFIFGKKGSGKSTLMTKWMVKDIRKGWTVYTDMIGLNINGVHYFKTLDLAKFVPPPNSSIYLDEVGLSMDNRNYKSFPEGLRDFFALQRKYRCKVVVNSQSYDVDKKVRDRVDRMILQSNIGNVIGISRPIRRSVTLVEASSVGESRICDQLSFAGIFSIRFTWLPSWFKYFVSFNPPPRDLLPSREISDGVSAKRQLRDIRRAFRK